MAILQEEQIEIKGGFKKQIDDGAKDLMFQILQRHQYQFPIKSTIREIVCNGLDSIKERDIAKGIITGNLKEEDYYIQKEGELFKDSKFDKDYYNLSYLSDNPNVSIDYYEGKEMAKDRVEITDNGVGLWDKRLVGYWNLGYSSKRLSTKTIGKFGIGNKSPLSINPMFTTVTVYNGRKAVFNVYSGTVESITPKFNLTTNIINEEHTVILADGTPYTFYTEPTEEMNKLTVIIEAKKHHKEQYIDAVKSQLLYFDNVRLCIHSADGHINQEVVSSPLIYETEQIIIADNNYYSKPHIVINGVNYGYINFEELELEEKLGNIGIKVASEEIEISPSRESLIWSDQTKAIVLKRFNDCAETATLLVQQELNEPDFLKWIKICSSLSGRAWNSKSPIARLSRLVDINKIKPTFNKTTLKYRNSLLNVINARAVSYITEKKANKQVQKVYRDKITFMTESSVLPFYLCTGQVSNRKDKYLLNLHSEGYVIVQHYSSEALHANITHIRKTYDKVPYQTFLDEYNLLMELIATSNIVLDYEAVIVPDSFKATDDEEDTIEEDKMYTTVSTISHEERRQAEGKTVLFTPRNIEDSLYNYGVPEKVYEWQKVEVPIKSINDWKEEEIYYSTNENAEMMQFVALLTRDTRQESFNHPRGNNGSVPTNPIRYWEVNSETGITYDKEYRCSHFFDTTKVKLIKVANDNLKYYKDFQSIDTFFVQFKNNKLTMSNTLIQWNTARKILPLLNKIAFLYNFTLDPERQQQFKDLVTYVKDNYRSVLTFKHEKNNVEQSYSDLITHLDKVNMFQDYIATQPTPEELAQVATEMWGNGNITEAQAIDMNVWGKFQDLIEWATPISIILNNFEILTGININHITNENQYTDRTTTLTISEELEKEIRWYLQHKQVTI
jgi:hypothetical protein